MSSGTLHENERRQALLDELRRLHRAEPAPAELRRRLLERVEHVAAVPGPGGAFRRGLGRAAGALVIGGRPRLVLALLGALALGVGLRSVSNGWPELRRSGGDARELPSSPPELALGPEPPGDPRAHAVLESSRVASDAQSRPCPLDELPRGAMLTPGKGGAPGLTVHTFEQYTPTCGPITRRYLEHLPPGLLQLTNAPVVILLHDAGESAEVMRARRGRLDFEPLARQNRVILIYANAAPGLATSPDVADSGAWQTDSRANRAIDDGKYLELIFVDLNLRNVIDGTNDIYLVGHGDGAAMALDAALRNPHGYTGVAAFAPSVGASGPLVEPLLSRASGRLSRIMLVLDVPPGGSAEAWRQSMPAFTRRWASVLGIEQRVIPHSWKFADLERPMGSVHYFDASLPATGTSAVRVYLVNGVGERRPGAPHAWDFLTGIDSGDPHLLDAIPELPMAPIDDPMWPIEPDGHSVLREDADGVAYPSVVLDGEVLTPRDATRAEP